MIKGDMEKKRERAIRKVWDAKIPDTGTFRLSTSLAQHGMETYERQRHITERGE